MAVKHKTVYLYLTLACFVGIILIFIFDGYMGVYDTLSMDNGQYPQVIEPDEWSQQEKYGYPGSTSVERSGLVDFTYEVDNRRFSEYSAPIVVSLWHNQEKLADLKSEDLIVPSFGKGEVKWSVSAGEIIPADFPAEQSYNVGIVVNRADIERKVIVNINPSPYPAKPVIIESSR